jgi:hemoglobin-like flavoprotein
MTPHQIALVRGSLEPLKPLAAQVAEAFYTQLFNRDPALRPLFRDGDMARQGERLMQMLAAAIELLDRPAVLQPVLLRLGQRHADYGVTTAHYDSVGTALLDTLAAALGAGFTPDVRAAWTLTYAHVAQAMQEGAAQAAVAA